jgi:hypothetical protein
MKTKETTIYDRHGMKWRNNQAPVLTSHFCALIEFFIDLHGAQIGKQIKICKHSIYYGLCPVILNILCG